MKTTTPCAKVVRLLFLVTLLIGIHATARAQNVSQLWSTVGSTGEPDDIGRTFIQYDGPTAFIATASIQGPPTVGTLRYQITPVDGLFFNGCKALKVRFRDQGEGANIKVYLRRTDIDAGGMSNLIIFNSDQFAAATGFQSQRSGCLNITFNFARYSYWIEVVLTQSDRSLSPALQMVQIVPSN
jgi:hypothetical protein